MKILNLVLEDLTLERKTRELQLEVILKVFQQIFVL